MCYINNILRPLSINGCVALKAKAGRVLAHALCPVRSRGGIRCAVGACAAQCTESADRTMRLRRRMQMSPINTARGVLFNWYAGMRGPATVC